MTYTSFDEVATITENGNAITYIYDPDHNRATKGNSQNRQIDLVYLDHSDVSLISGGNVRNKHFYIYDQAGQLIGEIDRTGITGSSNGVLPQ